MSAGEAAGKISVAMCTYNGRPFVAEQLGSILTQSRSVDEIVICDDGSTDGTVEIVADLAERSPVPVWLHRNVQRLGITRNFEQAIGRCTGEIIFLADQDDVWRPEKVAVLAASLADASVGLVFSDADIVNADLSPTGTRLWEAIWFDAQEQRRMVNGDAVGVLLRHAIAAGTTLAFRHRPTLLLPIPDLPHAHDIWITLLLAATTRVAIVPEPLVRYRLHGDNQVGMRRYGLWGQVRMARQQLRTKTFAFLVDLHTAAADRLLATSGLAPEVEQQLHAKIAHCRRRDQLPGWPRRLSTVFGEWRHGNYRRFSYGWKSVLQDLFLR